MHTLFDFITHIKGIEYIVSVSFIAGYILYWEALKPKPFKAVITDGKNDLDFMRKSDYKTLLKNVVSAPFIGLAYVATLPFVFMYAVGSAALNGMFGLAGRSASFGWRPTEAYLTGKKKEEAKGKKDETKQ